MAHNNPVFVGWKEGAKNSLSGGTANVLPLMRLSLNGTGPAAVKSFLFTIAFFFLVTFFRLGVDKWVFLCYIYSMLNKQQITSLNLTRRHFEFIACTLGEIEDNESRESVLTDTCIRLRDTHPRFDEKRFRERVQEVHEDGWSQLGCVKEDFLAGSNLWITFPCNFLKYELYYSNDE